MRHLFNDKEIPNLRRRRTKAWKQQVIWEPANTVRPKSNEQPLVLQVSVGADESQQIDDDLSGTDFNDVLNQYTDLDPISTGAIVVINETSLKDIAGCRASNYNATKYDTPTFECETFANSSCADNDYIDVDSNETENNVTQEFCLPDDYYCEDIDMCTDDTWDSDDEMCINTPVSCPQHQSCDPVDGTCKNDDLLVPAIAVIDEDDGGRYCNNARWAEFRDTYPHRPFCLLVPSENDTYIDIDIPQNALDDPLFQVHSVSRDNGDFAADDWFELCGLGDLGEANVPYIGLFVDVSGSMYKGTVKNSYNKFLEDLSNTGRTACEVFDRYEQLIRPFMTTLTPNNGGQCQEPKPYEETLSPSHPLTSSSPSTTPRPTWKYTPWPPPFSTITSSPTTSPRPTYMPTSNPYTPTLSPQPSTCASPIWNDESTIIPTSSPTY